MQSLYKEILLDTYRNPKNYGTINKPSKTVLISNPLCGDRIKMDIVFKENTVTDIKFTGQGCVISLALTSMLTDFAKHKKKNFLLKLDSSFMIKLLGIKPGPNRLKCALLPLEALKKLLV